ncbi:hypothetical protein GCM10010401_11640 [Rarobacter faecitabidus]|uniref:hypothetical protein n=1 Tax=Rarobacter faecitabidus TaxID=13243 RepID=UPI001150520C|nr:hypothetical protein [Rarobacter faecitabidus]
MQYQIDPNPEPFTYFGTQFDPIPSGSERPGAREYLARLIPAQGGEVAAASDVVLASRITATDPKTVAAIYHPVITYESQGKTYREELFMDFALTPGGDCSDGDLSWDH